MILRPHGFTAQTSEAVASTGRQAAIGTAIFLAGFAGGVLAAGIFDLGTVVHPTPPPLGAGIDTSRRALPPAIAAAPDRIYGMGGMSAMGGMSGMTGNGMGGMGGMAGMAPAMR
ncbi:MAG: hypothetical protein HQL41_14905 [Alphaproteobacteria bacterium]|nr:hypothetical protein [Alphaproteobacteria bacterium]